MPPALKVYGENQEADLAPNPGFQRPVSAPRSQGSQENAGDRARPGKHKLSLKRLRARKHNSVHRTVRTRQRGTARANGAPLAASGTMLE